MTIVGTLCAAADDCRTHVRVVVAGAQELF